MAVDCLWSFWCGFQTDGMMFLISFNLVFILMSSSLFQMKNEKKNTKQWNKKKTVIRAWLYFACVCLLPWTNWKAHINIFKLILSKYKCPTFRSEFWVHFLSVKFYRSFSVCNNNRGYHSHAKSNECRFARGYNKKITNKTSTSFHICTL